MWRFLSHLWYMWKYPCFVLKSVLLSPQVTCASVSCRIFIFSYNVVICDMAPEFTIKIHCLISRLLIFWLIICVLYFFGKKFSLFFYPLLLQQSFFVCLLVFINHRPVTDDIDDLVPRLRKTMWRKGGWMDNQDDRHNSLIATAKELHFSACW